MMRQQIRGLRLLGHNNAAIHTSTRREIAPVVLGLTVFVAANAAAYYLRAMQRKKQDDNYGGIMDDGDAGIHTRAMRRRGNQPGGSSPHPLYSPMVDHLGVDVGSGFMRISSLSPSSSPSSSTQRLPHVLEGLTGHRSTPSVVHLSAESGGGGDANGGSVVGVIAKERKFGDPSRTVSDLQAILVHAYEGGDCAGSHFGSFEKGRTDDDDFNEEDFDLDQVQLAYSSPVTPPPAAATLAGEPSVAGKGASPPPSTSTAQEAHFLPRNALAVQTLLLRDLLAGASVRVGGGRAGADRLDSATLVLSLPACLPPPVRSGLVSAASAAAREASRHAYASPAASAGKGGVEEAEEEEGWDEGAVVVGSIDDSKAAVLAALETGVFETGRLPEGPFLVVDVGARLVQATVLTVPADEHGDPLCGEPRAVSSASSRSAGADFVADALVEHLANEFAKGPPNKREKQKGGGAGGSAPPSSFDLRADPLALQRLHQSAEEACLSLSTSTQTVVNLPFISVDFATMQPLHLEAAVSRSVLEKVAAPALHALTLPAIRALREFWDSEHAGRDLVGGKRSGSRVKSRVGTVLLVGGGARSPLIRAALEAGVREAQGKYTAHPTPTVSAPGEASSIQFLVPAEPEEANVMGAALAAKYGWGDLTAV
mmetsp:Transcript_9208/g.18552  ORF Transcript_9208/g.18552 Transcript_9208/m.18552 type:complete len:654 (-) Transcript_9208:133-2094(-)